MSDRCPRKITWAVTYNWIGNCSHEYHRCIYDVGHSGPHKAKVRNYSRLRRPFGDRGRPWNEKNGFIEWENYD